MKPYNTLKTSTILRDCAVCSSYLLRGDDLRTRPKRIQGHEDLVEEGEVGESFWVTGQAQRGEEGPRE